MRRHDMDRNRKMALRGDRYTVNKGYRFSRPHAAGMPLTKLSLAGNNLIIHGGRVW
jgi:hypothetical protein